VAAMGVPQLPGAPGPARARIRLTG
jgi:hypothetical protein